MLHHRREKSVLLLSGLLSYFALVGIAVKAFAAVPPSQNFSSRTFGAAQPLSLLHQTTTETEGSDVNSSNELPANFPRRDDVLAALAAVRRACEVTAALQPDGDENERTTDNNGSSTVGTGISIAKKDLSPVTVADFAVQGLILHALKEQFPDDGFIAEEDSQSLQADEHLCQQVAAAASLSRHEVMKAIDLGKSYEQWSDNDEDGQSRRPSRVWVLDPIDGTRGFLRGKLVGGQYAIALALIDENGVPVIGILGCPNLPVAVDDENYAWVDEEKGASDPNSAADTTTRGCIFVASRGGGCYQLSLLEPSVSSSSVATRQLQVTKELTRLCKDARFCIGVERYSDALGQCGGMAKFVHGDDRALNDKGEIIRARRMDSQAKHGVIARGGAELYVRLPKPGYVEWIWDHAAGNVVIEEAGGTMSDVMGRPIDFSLGAQLSPDVRGVLMSAGGAFHTSLVGAFAAVDGQQAQ